jgi:hypothetical protein
MTKAELASPSHAWIKYQRAPKGSQAQATCAWATDLSDLVCDEPETPWLLILEIHRRDKSVLVQQGLSAGPVEDLLAKHGESFIGRVEVEARKDPSFATMLGGVWRNSMSDAIWDRLQAVWDRRGWNFIPE